MNVDSWKIEYNEKLGGKCGCRNEIRVKEGVFANVEQVESRNR